MDCHKFYKKNPKGCFLFQKILQGVYEIAPKKSYRGSEVHQLFSLVRLKWTTLIYITKHSIPCNRDTHNPQRFKQNFLISKFIFKNFRYIFVTEIKTNIKMNTIESLNANCNTYVRELNQTINFKKDGKVIKMHILKVYKKGTKRVFFAPYTEEFKLVGRQYSARKGEAVSNAESFAKWKLKQEEVIKPIKEEPKKLHKFRTRTMNKMLNNMQTKGFTKAAQYDGYIKDFKDFYGVDTYVNEYYELKLVDDITKTLMEIKKQIGLDLKPCDHFTGIREFNGKKYFNVMLETRVSESAQYQKLLSFGKYKVEPNGVERVSIFF